MSRKRKNGRRWALEVLSLATLEVLYRRSGLRVKDLPSILRKAVLGDLPPVEYPWETKIQIVPDGSPPAETVGEGKRPRVLKAWYDAALEALNGRSEHAFKVHGTNSEELG